jgi:DNA invertase Pin-like site-specific DNA recombinase
MKPKAAKPLAYSYIRFSHPDQAKGDSLRRQTELRDAWIARNQVTLDTALTLEDRGVSGYHGTHRGNPDRHALAAFVALVEKGQIARGSYLIVENLDRLSREDIVPALSLLLNLIQSGIRVVQLLPAETIFDDKSNPMHLMMAIMELSRGHSESAMKSERGGRAWQEKKRRAAENGEPLTARGPAWLRLVDGEWKIEPKTAAAVRRIYSMAVAGYGLTTITKKLNAENVQAAGRAGHWPRSYVAKILSNPAVIGVYQPYTRRGTDRRPDGDPVPNYYPSLITEQEWYAARAGLVGRRGKAGRPPKDNLNIFAGLLRDARDGGSVQLVNKGAKGGRVLTSYRAAQGVAGAKPVSFPFDTFEHAVLKCLREIDPRAILPHDKGADRAAAVAGRLAEVTDETEKVKARLQLRYSDALADVLERHESERKRLADELVEARQEAAVPLAEAWSDCRSLLDALDKAPDQNDARTRLRAAIRRITESVWCLFVGHGADRVAAVQVYFTGGTRRDYVILHRPAKANAAARTKSEWWVRSMADTAPGPFDLRKHRDAARLEKALLVAAEELTATRPFGRAR